MSVFTPWDYLVLVSILILFAIVGVYCRLTGGKQKTTKEYLLANSSMPAWPVSFSLMCSIMSAITLLGLAQESYQFGMTFVLITLAYIISTPIAAYLFLPVFYKMQTMSVYEYLEKRFGYATRLVASVAFSVQMILYMGIVLYAPALALEALTGIDRNASIMILGLLCTFYSTLGGMKAVLITDVLQSLLMFAAVFCVIFSAAFKENGFAEVWNTAVENGRLNVWEISPDLTIRHSLWSLIFGGIVTFLSLYAINQMQVQRLMSVRSLKSAQSALWLNLPILIGIIFTSLLTGLVIFHHYKNCDPVLEGRIHVRDQLMPLYIMDTMGAYPGLAGLIVSGIFSASLSTVSSAVSSLAAVTLEDYLKPFCEHVLHHKMLEKNTVLPSKITAFFYGIVCILLAFSSGSMGGVLQASLTIFGIIGGPLLGLFTIGMFTTRANQRGSLIGILTGLIFSFWIGFGKPKPPIPVLPITAAGCTAHNITSTMTALNATAIAVIEYPYLYRISYLWLSVFGFLITAAVGYCLSVILEKFSLATNDTIYLDEGNTLIDVDLFVPPLAKLLKRQVKAGNKAQKV